MLLSEIVRWSTWGLCTNCRARGAWHFFELTAWRVPFCVFLCPICLELVSPTLAAKLRPPVVSR